MSAAFFDLDRTLIDGATEKMLVAGMRRAGLLGWRELAHVVWAYLHYDRGVRDHEALKRQGVRLVMAGRPVEACTRVAAELTAALLAERLFPQARQAIDRHRAAGHRICIVSSAVDLVVAPIAMALQADAWFACALAVADGHFTGEIEGRVHAGETKAAAVRDFAARAGIDLATAHAYGDHQDDRFMLGCVGHPVAVNPDRRLRTVARESGWSVVRWHRP